jgi:nucleoside-diphosphate-sugar epimerase
MKVFLAGGDGYLGYALIQYLAERGHEVCLCDNYSRRRNVKEVGSHSITPIKLMEARLRAFHKQYGYHPEFYYEDTRDYSMMRRILHRFKPDCVAQFAEMPSAPFSMIDYEHAKNTINNNLEGTLSLIYAMREEVPEAHLLKVGSMGEYFYQGQTIIPEGFFSHEDTFRGESMEGMMFPRKSQSVYHTTKIQGTYLVEMASRFWNIRATDIMQGVVYGVRFNNTQDEDLLSRFDIDEHFGTVINRFCAQAVIGLPITPYGKGHQKRGFLPLRDSMQCFTLSIENPPAPGEYRVFNQLEEVCDVTELANIVKDVGTELGLSPAVQNIPNPRIEKEDHYYNPDHQGLLDLGYIPTNNLRGEIKSLMTDLLKYKDRILAVKDAIFPRTTWK